MHLRLPLRRANSKSGRSSATAVAANLNQTSPASPSSQTDRISQTHLTPTTRELQFTSPSSSPSRTLPDPQSPIRSHDDSTLDTPSLVYSSPPVFIRSSTIDTLLSDAKPLNMQRKIWVRRPGQSATLVVVHQDDLVDSVRDVILHKYANSLGKSIDSPDITLKIVSREQNKNASNERVLGPEEPIGGTLDSAYPGGQTIDEALVIEVPQRRTPKPSPRLPAAGHVQYYYHDDYRPGDGARDYFPPMAALHSPHLNSHISHPGERPPHSMSVLSTGQLPPLPSPGHNGGRQSRRPKYSRQHTSSPTIIHSTQAAAQTLDPKAHLNGIHAPPAPPLPTPPAQAHPDQHKPTVSPPNRTISPHPSQVRPNRKRDPSKSKIATNTNRSVNGDPAPPLKPASASLLDGTVPPINVLIVEDNVINLKLLEAFMKRLKVRWKSAMNGKEAVNMWRTGGFHLVLMDIQLPIMNGLDATKEIRRLEGVNGIGVFGESPLVESPATLTNGNQDGVKPDVAEDTLGDRSLFKSPVIIVALTASSLQSDRHEALAAGCNDFLTKPVNFVWMERKVTEWGCMQALIDYDGWRKWKQFADEKAKEDPAIKEREEKEEKAKTKAQLKAMFARKPPGTSQPTEKKDDKKDDSSSPEIKKDANGGPIGGSGPAKKQPGAAPSAQWQAGNHKRRGGSGNQTTGSTLGPTPEADEG